MKKINHIIQDFSENPHNINFITPYLKNEEDSSTVLKVIASRSSYDVAKGIFDILDKTYFYIPQELKEQFGYIRVESDEIKTLAEAIIDLVKINQVNPTTMKSIQNIVRSSNEK
jgi:hypothetical protein